ncbi:uncharacterized protein LOC135481087 [Liolophura sinensis]|uniref:uncharacterized protein LOC135481087 n=1 Tax=Liolophura sinensis TaxID=3198878 RepID=UPI003158F41B
MSNRFSQLALLASSLAFTCAMSTCKTDGCSTGFECRREKVLKSAKSARCLPNIRDIISDRLDQWEEAWAARDFQALEGFYTADSLFVPPGTALRNGSQGFAEFVQGLIDTNGWTSMEWTVKDLIYVTDELVFTIDTFEIQTNGDPVTGKDFILWKKEDGVYNIRYGAINTPA